MPSCLVPRSTTTIVRSVLFGGPNRSCYFSTCRRPLMPPPTPPPEKKWFYKEVWSALQPNVAKFAPRSFSQGCQKPEVALKDIPGPTTTAAAASTGGAWSQRFGNVRDRGFKLAEQYGLRDKLDMVFQHYCRFVTAVKDFFYQKRYLQMGSLLDDGLKRLEEKIRLTREGRKLGREDGGKRQSTCDGSGVKSGDEGKSKDEGKIVMKLRVKPEEKA